MRNINRLDDFYKKLSNIHKNVPDWRFGQFILNFISWHYNKYKRDIFYIEEDKMLKLFEEFIKEMRGY